MANGNSYSTEQSEARTLPWVFRVHVLGVPR